MFSISTTTIDIHQLTARLEDERAGAFVCFEGRVRNHNDGRQVKSLEYEAYEELALKEGRKVIEEAKEKFGIINCVAVHRTGALEIGDAAVWVGVVAAHRAEAFEGCRYIIDEIKHRLPVWKREHYADGKIEWVNCATCSSAHSPQPATSAPAQHQRTPHTTHTEQCKSIERETR